MHDLIGTVTMVLSGIGAVVLGISLAMWIVEHAVLTALRKWDTEKERSDDAS